jgi:hypothetical protein
LLKVALNTIAITSIYHSVKDSSFVTSHAEKAFYSQLFATLLYTQLWLNDWFELITVVVIGTDCKGSCKSNYHTIMTTMALLYHSGAYTDLYDTKLSIFYIEMSYIHRNFTMMTQILQYNFKHINWNMYNKRMVLQSASSHLPWFDGLHKKVCFTVC